MRIVIIGCGLIARSHTGALANIPEAELVAVCDQVEPAADKLAQECSCKAYYDAEEMLDAENPDVAVICVPTFAHRQYVELCCKKNINVLCEKPLEKTPEECGKIVKAVRESGVIFMTAQVVRFWTGYVELKKMYDSGELGDIYMMHFRRVSSKAGNYGKWLFIPELGGGGLHDTLVHDVDYLRYLAGPFKTGYANAYKDDTGCYNNIFANIEFKSGVKAVAECSLTLGEGYPFSFSFEVVGSKGTVEFKYSAGATIAERENSKAEMRYFKNGEGLRTIDIVNYDPYQKQMEYYLDCVKQKKQPDIITPEQSFEVISMIDALHRSADSGEVIQL